MTKLILAIDRETVRSVDSFGKMNVRVSNISKACVNPYYGREIPGWEALGLTADRVYQMLRDPGELARAAPTFNNLPLLDRHVPVSAEKPSKEFVVGSTGTDAVFAEPFLRNSLVIWDAQAIAGIRTNVQREISCGYAYRPDMTAGVFEGVPYDGIMRDIEGNHVALVEVGRAGPEVVVGDSKPSEKPKMSKKKLSIAASIAAAALSGALRPVLAQDAQLEGLSDIVGKVKSLKAAKTRADIVSAVEAKFGDKLAQDATLDHLAPLLAQLAQDEAEEAPVEKKAEDADPDEAEDEDDEGAKDSDDDKVDKGAMDAAIKTAERNAVAATVARMNAIRQAEKDVHPHVGELAVAQDSAEAVYRIALDAAKVDHTGITQVAALRAMVGMLPKAGATPKAVIAQDAATAAQGAALFDSLFINKKG